MMLKILLILGCLTLATQAGAVIIQPLPAGEHVIITESDPATIEIAVKSFLSLDPTALPANPDGTFSHTYSFGFDVPPVSGAEWLGMIEIESTGFAAFDASLTGPGIDPPLSGLPLRFQVEPLSSANIDIPYTLTIFGQFEPDVEIGQYVGSIAVNQVDIPEPSGLLLLLATAGLLSHRRRQA